MATQEAEILSTLLFTKVKLASAPLAIIKFSNTLKIIADKHLSKKNLKEHIKLNINTNNNVRECDIIENLLEFYSNQI